MIDEYLYYAVDAETGEIQDVANNLKKQRYFTSKPYLEAKINFRRYNKRLNQWKLKRVKIVEVDDEDDVINDINEDSNTTAEE